MTKYPNEKVKFKIEQEGKVVSEREIWRDPKLNRYGYTDLIQKITTDNLGNVVQSTIESVLEARKIVSRDNVFENSLQRLVYIYPQRQIMENVEAESRIIPSPNGSDLAKSLYYHFSYRTPKYWELQDTIKSIFPDVESVHKVPPVGGSGKASTTISVAITDRYTGKVITSNNF